MSVTDITAPPTDERPDWFINSIRGKLPENLQDMRDNGIYAGNFNIRDKEDYWNLDEVKGAFTDEQGTVHKDKFDKFYKQQDTSFKNNLQLERFSLINDGAFASKYAESLGNFQSLPIVIEAAPDVNGRFYNSNRLEAEMFGPKAYGARENAVANGVIDEQGNKMTIDEWENSRQGFWTGTLKFAKDSNGQWLRNEDGDTYLTPVAPGEKISSFDELYSQYSDITGRYGTGEGFWQGAGGILTSIIKAPINVAVGTTDGILTAIEAVTDSLGAEGGEFEKSLVDLRNRVNSNRITMSEKGIEDWTSLESLVGMTTEGVMQLIQMMTGTGALRAIGMGAKMSSFLPMLNMGMMGGAGIYDLARERGYSPKEAAAMYGLTVTGLTILAKLDDKLIKSMMGGSEISTATIEGFAKAVDVSVKGSLSKASLMAIYKNIPQTFVKLNGGVRRLGEVLPATGLGKAVSSAAKEGVQEFSEQAFETGIKKMGNVYSELMYEGVEDKPSFELDMEKEIQSWKQAAVGGILTGGVAPFIMKRFYGSNDAPDTKITQVYREIVNGRANNIYKLIDRLHKEQRLAPSWENADGQYISQPTNKEQQKLSDTELAEQDKTNQLTINASKNDIAANILRSNIKAIEELVESKGFKNFATAQKINLNGALKQMTNFDALKIAIGLGEKNEYNIDGRGLYENYTTAGRDASKLLVHINKLDADIENFSSGAVKADSELVKQTTEQRDKLQSKLDRIKNGEFTKDYVAEGLYNMMSFQTLPKDLKQKAGDVDLADVLSPITGKSFISLNNSITEDSAKVKELATKAVNKQIEVDKDAKVTSNKEELLGISLERKQELLTESLDNLSSSAENVLTTFEADAEDNPDDVVAAFDGTARDGLDTAKKKVLDKYIEDSEIVKKINSVGAETKLPIAPEQEEGVRLNQFLNTVKDSPESEVELEVKTSDSVSLDEVLADEEAAFKNKPDEYIELDEVDKIAEMISQRSAQVLGTLFLNGHNLTNLQQLSDKQSDELLKKLDDLKLRAAVLADRARYNLENPELAIKTKAIKKIKAINANLDAISDDYTRSLLEGEHAEIVDEIIKSRLTLYQAVEDGDILAHQTELNRLEDRIYAIGGKSINALLAPIKPKDFDKASINEKLAYKKKYDYLLGVLSLQSSKFYDVYHKILSGNPDGMKPSIEQRLIIKEAVHKASIKDYNIDGFESVHIDARRYQNTILIDGGGGSGKTSIVAPTIASILSELNGKKIFTTSVDIGNKISNAVDSVSAFGENINTYKGSKKTIEELFDSPEDLKDVGVIVFDEVTLLHIYSLATRKTNAGASSADIITFGLSDIVERLNQHNTAFENNKVKLVYTGDSRQNIESLPEQNRNMGIHSVYARVPKTGRIEFSFRSQNRPLVKLAEYFEKIQSKHSGFLKDLPVLNNSYESFQSTIDDSKISHKRRVGVTIVNNGDSFNNKVNDYVNSLAESDKANTAYITDDNMNVPSSITENNIPVLTSIEAQGEEWDNVIINLTNKEVVSTTLPTYASKKAYYTAVTRAKNYVMLNLPASQKLKSQAGTVVKSKTVDLPNNTRADEVAEVEQILGREVQTEVAAEVATKEVLPDSNPDNVNPDSIQEGDDNIDPLQEADNPIEVVSNFLEDFRNKAIQLHTFYTTDHPDKSLAEIHALKSKLLYDKTNKFHSYNLVIAKRNSPEYRNIVRNDSQYNEQYALLLEGVDNSPNSGTFNKTILGVYNDEVGSEVFDDKLNEIIQNNNIFPNGATSRVIALDGDVFTVNGVKVDIKQGSVRGPKGTSTNLEDLFEPTNSPGIVRGSIKILKNNIVDPKTDKIKKLAGSSFVPVSYKFRTPEEIDAELEKIGNDNIIDHPHIMPVFIKGNYLQKTDLVKLLSPFATEDYFDPITQKTFKNFPKTQASTNLFSVIYDSVFGRLTFSGSAHGDLSNTRSDTNPRLIHAYFNRAIQGVYERAVNEGRDAGYVGFVNEWLADGTLPDTAIKNAFDTGFIQPTEEAAALLKLQGGKLVTDGKRTNKPYFFMQRYVEAELRGKVSTAHNKRLKYFNQLFDDLQSQKLTVQRFNQNNGEFETIEKDVFTKGFQTSVVGISGVDYDASPFLPSTESLFKDSKFYDKNFRIDNGSFISLPSANASAGALIDILQNKGTVVKGAADKGSAPGATSESSDKNADFEMGSDGDQIRVLKELEPVSSPIVEDADKYKVGKSLTEFQQKHYAGTNNIFLDESIAQFKNRVWSAIFSLKGATPEMQDINDPTTIGAVKNYLIGTLDKSLDGAILNNSETRTHYHSQVHAVEFDFLMSKYMSSFKKGLDADGNVIYKAAVTDFKSNVYNRETDTIMDDTMNEMVETMFNNTKQMYYETATDGSRVLRVRTTSDGVPLYLDKESLEELVPFFQNANDIAEITQNLKDDIEQSDVNLISPAALAIYHQFFAPDSYMLGSEVYNSFARINNTALAQEMVEGFTSLARTTDVFKYATLNLGEGSGISGIPSVNAGAHILLRELIVRDISLNALNLSQRLSYDDAKQEYTFVATDDTPIVISRAQGNNSREDLVKVMQELGITQFTDAVYNELLTTKGKSESGIQQVVSGIALDVLRRVNQSSRLSDGGIRKLMSGMINTEFNNYIINPIRVANGMHINTMHVNSEGNLVGRLRNKILTLRLKEKIAEFQKTDGVFSNNMFVRPFSQTDVGSYRLSDWVAKDGIKYKNAADRASKPHTKFSNREHYIHDIQYGFFEQLKKTDANSSSFKVVMSTMLFGDSSTEIMPVISLNNQQVTSPELVLEEFFNSQAIAYKKILASPAYSAELKNKTEFKDKVNTFVNGDFNTFKGNFDANVVADIRVKFETFAPDEAADIRKQIEEQNVLAKSGIVTYKQFMDAYVYNWLAISTELSDLSVGKFEMFKSYADYSKRFKMQSSSRSSWLFRQANWTPETVNGEITDKSLLEGRKLNSTGQIIYVNDKQLDDGLTGDTGVRRLTSLDLSRNNEVQEVLDGATFTNPITRIFQRASAGGRFGTPTPAVSKPVTNSTNYETGISTGIKNAEFELTAEVMRNSTPFAKKLMNNMLRGDVRDMLIEVINEGVVDRSSKEVLVEPIAADENTVYDNVQDSHFREVADRLVEQNKQDELVHEIIPISSKKYGDGVNNPINSDIYETTTISFLDKGQQLDASHNVTEKTDIKLVTQFVNAAAINAKNIGTLTTVYNAIGELANIADQDWNSDNIDVANEIRTVTKKAINKRLSVTYQHGLVNNPTEWSLTDRQVLKTALGQLNSNIEKNGVRINLFGGQYILHPQSDIISLRRVQLDNGSTRVYLTSEVPEGANIVSDANGVPVEADLEFIEPTLNNVPLSEHPDYIILRSDYEAAIKKSISKADKEGLLKEFQQNVDNILTDEWLPGYAETLLPMAIGNQFKISQADLETVENIDGFNAKFFLGKIKDGSIANKSDLSNNELSKIIADNFESAIKVLNVRIPTTGKHSAVVSKIAGFIGGTSNNVYVSPMLLFITGADQDIDKGNIIIPRAVNGIIPRMDEDFNFDVGTRAFFTNQELINGVTEKDAAGNDVLDKEGKPIHLNLTKIALTNAITEGLIEISEDPVNAVESSSAVDALLIKMKELVKKDAPTYNRDSYSDYITVKKETQTGANLISVFANHQKVYQVLYAYETLGENTVGLTIPEGLDRISETFAAFVNAATDNTNEQILGPMGVTENNANIVSHLIIEGATIEQIHATLKRDDFQEDLAMLESRSDYDKRPPLKENFNSPEFYELYNRGKELNLINSVIMNRRLPNSPYDMFKATYNITRNLDIRVNGERYNHQLFLLDESGEYAADAIAAMDKAVENGTYKFNILRIANPFDTVVPANYYNKLFARALKIKNAEFSILKNTDNLLLFSKQASGKFTSIPEFEHLQALDFMYGLGIHTYLAEESSDGLKLGDMVERTKWVKKMNEELIPEMIAKHNSSGNPNYFLNNLFRDEVDTPRYKKSMVWRLPDIRELNETTALSYKVAFNTLLNKNDRRKLILYNWITTGGKFGKGSFAQIIDNNALMQGINSSIEQQFNTMTEEDVRGLISVYEDFKKGRINDGKLLSNAIPYARPEEIQGRVRTNNPLNLGNDAKNDELITGQSNAFAQDKVTNGALKDIVNEYQISNRPKGPVIENVTQIVSAGNTGVESIALSSAKGLGVETTGVTRGDITKKPNPEFVNKFGLSVGDINSVNDNIKNSDVTIMFGADKDENNEDVLHQIKNAGQPVIIVSDSARESDKAKTSVDKLLGNYKNAIYVNSPVMLRKALKDSGYSKLNITGQRKLSSNQHSKISATLSEALTENLFSSYVSVKNFNNESITVDSQGEYQYYPNDGNDSEPVKNVYYSSDVPNDVKEQISNGELTLRPVIIGVDNSIIPIDTKNEVERLRNNGENIALGVFENGAYTNTAYTLTTNPKMGDFTVFQNADSGEFKSMNSVSFINNGSQNIDSTSATLDIKGSNSTSKVSVKYHGKLTKFEALAKLSDENYVAGLGFTSETARKHVFTAFQVGAVEADKFMAEMPTTYTFDGDGNVPEDQERAVWRHVKMLSIKNDDAAAFRYLEDFTQEGALFTEVFDWIDNKFNQFQQKRINQHSRQTREELLRQKIVTANNVIETRIKEEVLTNLLDDAGTSPLREGVMNAIKADISTFLTKNALMSYSTVFNNNLKLNPSSRNIINAVIKSKFKEFSSTDKVSKTKTSSKPKNGKGKEKNTSKVNKATAGNKPSRKGSFKYYMNRIEFAKDLTGKRKKTEVDNLFTEVAHDSPNFKSNKQRAKLLAELNALNSENSYTNNLAAFFKTNIVRGDGIRATNSTVLNVSKKDLPKFRALLGRLGYDLTVDDPKLTDATSDGNAIIDVLNMAIDSDNTTDFDKQFSKALILQYEAARKDMSNEELEDIRRFCAKLKS